MPTYSLDKAALRAIFPRAPQAIIDALYKGRSAFNKAGITDTKRRLSYCFANVEHECGGFTIPNLTENINYSHARMAQVWPNRFDSASDVMNKYGTSPGWQRKAFDDIYGNRMGNRPGTSDGSRYIGRGGPQITGRDGYAEIEKRTGIPLVSNPGLASLPEHQAAIIAAFWSWKNLNVLADKGLWREVVVRWNGGTNGLADRNAMLQGNDPIIERLRLSEMVGEAADAVIAQRPKVTPEAGTAGGIGAGGGAIAVEAARRGVDPSAIVAILVITAVLAFGTYFIIKNMRNK